MRHNTLYIVVITIAFAVFAIVFLFFPRSTYSRLERRELDTFPEYKFEKLKNNTYTRDVSAWFSDSEPFRDEFMSASMCVRSLLRLTIGNPDEAVSFHASAGGGNELPPPPPDATAEEIQEYQNRINADQNAKLAGHGIIIVGSGDKVRALMAYGGRAGGEKFAEAVNTYKSQLSDVNVYAMVLPLASEFYTPDKAKKATNPQLPTIKNIYAHLRNVKGIDAYSALAAHVEEDIYLRTDHHWAPLGAFYAAQAFARIAGVPFQPITHYERHVLPGFVGTMYGYSKDAAVKNAPEDFVYYTPTRISYTTTYRNYQVDKNFRVTSEGKEYSGPFFYKFGKKNVGGAYSTFMGSDMKLTRVKTGIKNKRRLMIIKDSYGNAIPGYLFYSFEEIHVVDFRYFTHNMRKYVRDNGITDILFAVNVFNAYSGSVPKKLTDFLKQSEGSIAPREPSVPQPKPASEPTHTEQKPTKPHTVPHNDPTPTTPPDTTR